MNTRAALPADNPSPALPADTAPVPHGANSAGPAHPSQPSAAFQRARDRLINMHVTFINRDVTPVTAAHVTH